jgi:hypothetical protein
MNTGQFIALYVLIGVLVGFFLYGLTPMKLLERKGLTPGEYIFTCAFIWPAMLMVLLGVMFQNLLKRI